MTQFVHPSIYLSVCPSILLFFFLFSFLISLNEKLFFLFSFPFSNFPSFIPFLIFFSFFFSFLFFIFSAIRSSLHQWSLITFVCTLNLILSLNHRTDSFAASAPTLTNFPQEPQPDGFCRSRCSRCYRSAAGSSTHLGPLQPPRFCWHGNEAQSVT